jgi:hypothetical protein
VDPTFRGSLRRELHRHPVRADAVGHGDEHLERALEARIAGELRERRGRSFFFFMLMGVGPLLRFTRPLVTAPRTKRKPA